METEFIAIIGSPSYPNFDAVAERVAALPEWAVVCVADNGRVARAASAAARCAGLALRRVQPRRAPGDDFPPWHVRNRALLTDADTLLVFAERPLKPLWHAIELCPRLGLEVQVIGADGAIWNPPITAADPRPNGRPFYIRQDCRRCGAALVLTDTLDDASTPPEHLWYDEWCCPRCRKGTYLDWPRWYTRRLGNGATEAGITWEELRAGIQRTQEHRRRFATAMKRGNLRAAERHATALVELTQGSYDAWDALAQVHLRKGATTEAVAALRRALESFVNDSPVGEAEEFQRMRWAWRGLG